jgi:hypothetical protein
MHISRTFMVMHGRSLLLEVAGSKSGRVTIKTVTNFVLRILQDLPRD